MQPIRSYLYQHKPHSFTHNGTFHSFSVTQNSFFLGGCKFLIVNGWSHLNRSTGDDYHPCVYGTIGGKTELRETLGASIVSLLQELSFFASEFLVLVLGVFCFVFWRGDKTLISCFEKIV